jgi:hypothetical protein
MFDLSCDKNRFPVVAKNQKGEDVTFDLFYRRPTTEEIIGYNSRLFQKKNGKVVNNVVPTRIEMGLKILTGFQDGIFWVNGKPVSSDSSSPDYYPAWKELLKSLLAGTVANFAFRVFEVTQEAQADPEDLLATDEEGEEAAPLGKS